MDCGTFNRQLEDYLQGGMDFPRRFGVERHAQQCYGCGKQLADAQKIGQMARELRRVSPPASFEASVMARIQTEEVRRRSWRLWKLWVFGWESFSWQSFALVSTALALAIVGTLLYFSPYDNAQPVSQGGIDGGLPAFQQGLSPFPSDSAVPQSVRSNTPGPILLQSNDYYYGEWPVVYVDPDNEGWIEIPVSGPSGDKLIRLPKTLRMQYGQPSEKYFIRNVSH